MPISENNIKAQILKLKNKSQKTTQPKTTKNSNTIIKAFIQNPDTKLIRTRLAKQPNNNTKAEFKTVVNKYTENTETQDILKSHFLSKFNNNE